MRTHGTLAKWNDDRGFGFIAPAQGGAELFVHVSAFPRDGVRPAVGELVSFETEAGPDGKLRAVRVMRPGRSAGAAGRRKHSGERGSRAGSLVGTVFALLAVAAIGVYAFTGYTQDDPEPVAVPAVAASPAPSPRFSCDGRTMCSQMTSCAEARFFLQHCPDTKMDGNGDGEPCERQWCN